MPDTIEITERPTPAGHQDEQVTTPEIITRLAERAGHPDTMRPLSADEQELLAAWESRIDPNELAARLLKSRLGMFAGRNSWPEMQAYVELLAGSERALAATILGMTYNTAMTVLAAGLTQEAPQ